MQNLTPEGLRIVDDVARRHGVSLDAVVTLLGALVQGNGRQAQFNHPDLGGMGQWSQGGMIMVGDMFNQGLKYRVDALCNELAGLLRDQPLLKADAGSFQSQSQSGGDGVSLFVAGSVRPANGGQRNWAVPRPPAPRMICDTPVFLARAVLRSNRAGGSASTTPASIGSGILPAAGRRSVADLHQPIRARARRRFALGRYNARSARKKSVRVRAAAGTARARSVRRGGRRAVSGACKAGCYGRHFYDDRASRGASPKGYPHGRGIRGEKNGAFEPPLSVRNSVSRGRSMSAFTENRFLR